MSRGLSTAVKSLLDALGLPMMAVTLDFETLGLQITNWPKSIVVGTTTYTGAKASSNQFTVKGEGFAENLKFEAPTAVIEIGCLSGWVQEHFFNDAFREDTCVVTLLYYSAGSFITTGWSTRYKCDTEEIDANKIRIRLGSLDAVSGTEIPRRTTQSDGCQWKFQFSDATAGCTFRYNSRVHRPALSTCDRTYDGPNGCTEHYPDIVDPISKTVIPRPKPYGGFLGSIDHRLVRSG